MSTVLWGPKAGRPRMERLEPRRPVVIAPRRQRPRPARPSRLQRVAGWILDHSLIYAAIEWWEDRKHAVYMEKTR